MRSTALASATLAIGNVLAGEFTAVYRARRPRTIGAHPALTAHHPFAARRFHGRTQAPHPGPPPPRARARRRDGRFGPEDLARGPGGLRARARGRPEDVRRPG